MNKGAGVLDPLKNKREEKLGVRDVEPAHTWLQWVGVNEHTVVSTVAMTPSVDSMYTFRTHAANTRNVAQRVECSYGRGVNEYFFG